MFQEKYPAEKICGDKNNNIIIIIIIMLKTSYII